MKQGHYKLSIKPSPQPPSGLERLENYGRCVMIVAVIYGGFYLMGVTL